jgi:hypothetical protein
MMVWLGVAAAAAPALALAHHSIGAVYDRERTVEVEGVLSKIELVNPHAQLQVTVPARTGPATVWMAESRGVAGMTRIGFDRGVVAVGDKVTLKGAPARSGEHSLWLHSLETAGGKTFDFDRGFGPRQP